MFLLGKIYNTIYNGLARIDSFLSHLGKPKVDAVTSASPTAAQAIKQDHSIAYQAAATAQGIPTIVEGSILPTAAKSLSSSHSTPHSYTSSGGSGYHAPATSGYHAAAPSAVSLNYLNADLAKYYGMNQTTAYNEALSNTAYQRAVKDMEAAGLNPAVLFGNGRVSGADGVFGATPLSAPSYGGSGGSSGYSRRSSGSRSSGKLFSSDAYAAISGAGALIGAVIGVKSGNAGIGALTGSNIATSAAKVLNGFYKKFK